MMANHVFMKMQWENAVGIVWRMPTETASVTLRTTASVNWMNVAFAMEAALRVIVDAMTFQLATVIAMATSLMLLMSAVAHALRMKMGMEFVTMSMIALVLWMRAVYATVPVRFTNVAVLTSPLATAIVKGTSSMRSENAVETALQMLMAMAFAMTWMTA
jgi:hypothetical protein